MSNIKIVYRDLSGAVINIGPWEYKFKKVAMNPPPEDLIDTTDWDYKYETIAENPLPDGAHESLAEVIEGLDGGLYVDHVPLRRQAYPSIGDQLDALFKAGAFPPDMAAQLQAVKDKYKKPL